LVLLLEEGNRFSIDIDIISNAKREELEGILTKVIESSRFTGVELNEHRTMEICKQLYDLSKLFEQYNF